MQKNALSSCILKIYSIKNIKIIVYLIFFELTNLYIYIIYHHHNISNNTNTISILILLIIYIYIFIYLFIIYNINKYKSI